MEEFETDRKRDSTGIQCVIGLENNRINQNLQNGEPRLKIGDRYLVRRYDDTWRKSSFTR